MHPLYVPYIPPMCPLCTPYTPLHAPMHPYAPPMCPHAPPMCPLDAPMLPYMPPLCPYAHPTCPLCAPYAPLCGPYAPLWTPYMPLAGFSLVKIFKCPHHSQITGIDQAHYNKILIFFPTTSLKCLRTARINELADSNEPAIILLGLSSHGSVC